MDLTTKYIITAILLFLMFISIMFGYEVHPVSRVIFLIFFYCGERAVAINLGGIYSLIINAILIVIIFYLSSPIYNPDVDISGRINNLIFLGVLYLIAPTIDSAIGLI